MMDGSHVTGENFGFLSVGGAAPFLGDGDGDGDGEDCVIDRDAKRRRSLRISWSRGLAICKY